MKAGRLSLLVAVLVVSGCAPALTGDHRLVSRYEYVCADGSHNWHCDGYRR